jgi:carbohydrate-selective porin OprB
MTYLKGSLDAYFQTSIPLDGEKIWDWDADKFTFTILDFDGYTENRSLYSKTQTQTL